MNKFKLTTIGYKRKKILILTKFNLLFIILFIIPISFNKSYDINVIVISLISTYIIANIIFFFLFSHFKNYNDYIIIESECIIHTLSSKSIYFKDIYKINFKKNGIKLITKKDKFFISKYYNDFDQIKKIISEKISD